MNDTVR